MNIRRDRFGYRSRRERSSEVAQSRTLTPEESEYRLETCEPRDISKLVESGSDPVSCAVALLGVCSLHPDSIPENLRPVFRAVREFSSKPVGSIFRSHHLPPPVPLPFRQRPGPIAALQGRMEDYSINLDEDNTIGGAEVATLDDVGMQDVAGANSTGSPQQGNGGRSNSSGSPAPGSNPPTDQSDAESDHSTHEDLLTLQALVDWMLEEKFAYYISVNSKKYGRMYKSYRDLFGDEVAQARNLVEQGKEICQALDTPSMVEKFLGKKLPDFLSLALWGLVHCRVLDRNMNFVPSPPELGWGDQMSQYLADIKAKSVESCAVILYLLDEAIDELQFRQVEMEDAEGTEGLVRVTEVAGEPRGSQHFSVFENAGAADMDVQLEGLAGGRLTKDHGAVRKEPSSRQPPSEMPIHDSETTWGSWKSRRSEAVKGNPAFPVSAWRRKYVRDSQLENCFQGMALTELMGKVEALASAYLGLKNEVNDLKTSLLGYVRSNEEMNIKLLEKLDALNKRELRETRKVTPTSAPNRTLTLNNVKRRVDEVEKGRKLSSKAAPGVTYFTGARTSGSGCFVCGKGDHVKRDCWCPGGGAHRGGRVSRPQA